MDKTWLRSFILAVVKPLMSGKTVTQATDGTSTLDNLFPDGSADNRFRMASPFGSISWVPKGVSSFYQSIFGGGFENVILGFLHLSRPSPSAPGEHILYSTDGTGKIIQVKITLGSDGTLTISASGPVNVTSGGKATITAAEVDITTGSGSLMSALLGQQFQTTFNNHVHLGDLGTPTGAPVTPSTSADLSTVLKTT